MLWSILAGGGNNAGSVGGIVGGIVGGVKGCTTWKIVEESLWKHKYNTNNNLNRPSTNGFWYKTNR